MASPKITRGPSVCMTCGARVVWIDNGTHWKAMDLLSESEHVCIVKRNDAKEPTP